MATFVYYWKTPDNARHGGEIEAWDREEAFALLRERGIRAIKVEPKGWETGNGYRGVRKRVVVILMAAAAVVTAAAMFWLGRGGDGEGQPLADGSGPQMKTNGAHAVAYRRLTSKASALKKLHEGEIGTLGLEVLRDYSKLSCATNGLAMFKGVLDEAHRMVDRARSRTKALFRDIYSVFPPDCVGERMGAQKLYGELMTEIDTTEERINADEAMLRLLDGNRGGWCMTEDGISFSDQKLANEFSFLMQDAGAAGLRWQRDFKH